MALTTQSNPLYDKLELVKTGIETVTLTNTANVVSQGVQTTTINHNLDFEPAHLVYIRTPSDFPLGAQLQILPITTFVNDDPADGPFIHISASISSTVLTVRFNHGFDSDYSPDGPVFTIRYYLFREPSG